MNFWVAWGRCIWIIVLKLFKYALAKLLQKVLRRIFVAILLVPMAFLTFWLGLVQELCDLVIEVCYFFSRHFFRLFFFVGAKVTTHHDLLLELWGAREMITQAVSRRWLILRGSIWSTLHVCSEGLGHPVESRTLLETSCASVRRLRPCFIFHLFHLRHELLKSSVMMTYMFLVGVPVDCSPLTRDIDGQRRSYVMYIHACMTISDVNLGWLDPVRLLPWFSFTIEWLCRCWIKNNYWKSWFKTCRVFPV